MFSLLLDTLCCEQVSRLPGTMSSHHGGQYASDPKSSSFLSSIQSVAREVSARWACWGMLNPMIADIRVKFLSLCKLMLTG